MPVRHRRVGVGVASVDSAEGALAPSSSPHSSGDNRRRTSLAKRMAAMSRHIFFKRRTRSATMPRILCARRNANRNRQQHCFSRRILPYRRPRSSLESGFNSSARIGRSGQVMPGFGRAVRQGSRSEPIDQSSRLHLFVRESTDGLLISG